MHMSYNTMQADGHLKLKLAFFRVQKLTSFVSGSLISFTVRTLIDTPAFFPPTVDHQFRTQALNLCRSVFIYFLVIYL